MLETRSIAPNTNAARPLLRAISLAVVLVYQTIAIVAFAVIVVQANNWLSRPFLGGFLEHTLSFNDVGPSSDQPWAAYAQGLRLGYRLVSLDGRPVGSARELSDLLSAYQPGDAVTLQVQSPQGSLESRRLTLQEFPRLDRLTFFYLPYLMGLIYLGAGLWVFALRRDDSSGRAFAIFSTSVAISIAGLFDLFTTHALVHLWTFAIVLAGGGLIALGMIFPVEFSWVRPRSWLHYTGYGLAAAIAAYAFPTLFNQNRPFEYVAAWRVGYIYTGLATLFFLITTAYRRYTSSSPMIREQARLILWGAAFSLLPVGAWFLVTVVAPSVTFSPYLLIPVILFPIMTAYAIMRYRMLNTDFLLSRAILYTLLSVLAASGYALLVTGMSLIFGQALSAENPFLIGLMIFVLAILLTPFRNSLQSLVDAAFFRGQMVYRERAQAFSRELTQAMELPAILKLLRQYIAASFYPQHLHLFVYEPLVGQYAATPDESGRPTSDVRFPANSALAVLLSGRRRNALFLKPESSIPAALVGERARLALLHAQIFIPLPGRSRLIGWIAVGPRRSGEPYTGYDITFMETLGDQAALAIERAQVIADLERRVHEMNVLARIAEGINVTLDFDDILELIYAQTNLLIPARDYAVTLLNRAANTVYHAFYLQNDERLQSQEQRPLPEGRGLEQIILRTRKAIVTDDYERECRNRGVLPALEGIYAWIGVPLNAGAETIGVFSLGSRDLSVVYTDEQLRLMQAIADQAAGAIVKASLYDESRRRTRQLSTLNEVLRDLGSTLDIDALLNRILKNAADILDCQAGSLFLLDQDTGELVFQVTHGPVASNLIGQRLPPGTGVVGKAVASRAPVIANDVLRNKDWFGKPDEQTGFRTEALLVVPMIIKERVIGVIEVINKRNGMPFVIADQELLAAFAAQAAVAYENARLYTLTDQALAARVEELSVMQRIDRELNASLDVERAMRITLQWAMRQSRAEAGLVGVLEEQELRVMAAEGYTRELPGLAENPRLPLSIVSFNKSIQSGQPQVTSSGAARDHGFLLEHARSQVVIPIRRETQVVGLLALESLEPGIGSDEALGFLARLSDHASIAISNAQLYTAVQLANQAKSDFISMVSHELKTPMTSIRGYTDLLSAGVVGTVNDNQANFLTTIRSNVDRMQVLVSDLTDVARIEAGRLRLSFQAVSLPEAVQEVVRSVQAQANEKKQVLHLNVPSDLPAVWADRGRLIQILVNLVSNAIKYSPAEAQVFIDAEGSENLWDSEGASMVVHLSVRDTGYGIAPEDQKKIFQKFFRSDDQEVRNVTGTGLGLNITRYLVEMQGGKIWFESEFRQGTTFHFTVPIAEAG
jgi:signal transduction histidine kinase